ncbi:imidazole glycerol phosphate synthase subunit HisH [Synechococcus sp. CS-1325]|uniref:imidazole glycerol phosphate synthase subunit HisH n=1 Tax=unclassified Synechococcus TaxID=2626047 RepID=UPI000DB6A2A5|nr:MULTISPECIES: imidazole glycerol phosphate synthase subunit HisH [unclassified Synechococcus]MCT0199836.1 imidazole glycerol phosphate synthase subunit HisH [Synechococcus sp. CS-1325]MCT0231386.1 imidazole glycerol phosphate synthase subunit HisH [Synechococcus sp. CS-1324]PZU98239.1 MAG: imidazole glycerol phosphate synthase subunit HisH [Cyanobium sp.]PZV03295.1 MAG: imidazole glycerol phosphate synthase subunit HisH [Cyanobium sp.]
MSRIGLIDYGMGNLHSVARAIERLGGEVALIQSGAAMQGCHALILPGVGAFDPAMQRLESSGLVEPILAWSDRSRPLLGICLGLQLLFEASDEGDARGLGLLKGRVRALPSQPDQPVPHMGWAPLIACRPTPLLPEGSPPAWVYFVHSYAAVPEQPACLAAAVAFGDTVVTAAVWQDHLAACQFHPEKSGPQGQRMLRRWLTWVEREDR